MYRLVASIAVVAIIATLFLVFDTPTIQAPSSPVEVMPEIKIN